VKTLFEQYKTLAAEKGISRETYERCVGSLAQQKNLVVERLFAFFDRDGNGFIDFAEWVLGLSVLSRGSSEERLKCIPLPPFSSLTSS